MEGEQPHDSLVLNTSPSAPGGTQKGGQLPWGCPPGCFVGFCGQSCIFGFIPMQGPLETGWVEMEEALRASTSTLGIPLPPFLPHHRPLALASLTIPSRCQVEHVSFSSDPLWVFQGILNSEEKKEKRELEEHDKRAPTKLGALCPFPRLFGQN